MLGHVLAFGQDISLLGHVKKHHMLGHVLAFGLYQQGSHQHTLFIKSSIRHGIHLVLGIERTSVNLSHLYLVQKAIGRGIFIRFLELTQISLINDRFSIFWSSRLVFKDKFMQQCSILDLAALWSIFLFLEEMYV